MRLVVVSLVAAGLVSAPQWSPAVAEEVGAVDSACEWVGSASARYVMAADNGLVNGLFRDSAVTNVSFVSGEGLGPNGFGCNATVTGDYSRKLQTASELLCNGEPVLVAFEQIETVPSSSAAGYYFAGIGSGGSPSISFGDGSLRLGTYSNSWSGCEPRTTTGSYEPDLLDPYLGSICSPAPVPATAQAIAGACSSTSDTFTNNAPHTSTNSMQWRMRRSNCDTAVDSDSDGLGDCAEHDRGTLPANADTDGDGRTDGDEVAAGTDPLVPDTGTPVGDGDNDGRDDTAEGKTGPGTGVDTDGDDLPDFMDTDSDNDGIGDADESDDDCDSDGVANWRDGDQCSVASGCAAPTVTERHITSVDASAEFGLFGPDIFEFVSTVNWCEHADGTAEVSLAEATGEMVAPIIGSALEEFGFTLAYDTRAGMESVHWAGSEAALAGQFGTCVDASTVLLSLLAPGLGKLAGKVARKMAAYMKKNTGVSVMDALNHVLIEVTDEVGTALARIESKYIRAVENLDALPDAVESFLRKNGAEAFELLEMAVITTISRQMRAAVANLAADGAKLSAKTLEAVLQGPVSGSLSEVATTFDYCGVMWTPQVTVDIAYGVPVVTVAGDSLYMSVNHETSTKDFLIVR